MSDCEQELFFKQLVSGPQISLGSELLVLICDQDSQLGAVSPEQRWLVYARSYRIRLWRALQEDFPVLFSALDSGLCQSLFDVFLCENPSRSWSLNDLGQAWLDYLQSTELSDVFKNLARYEWDQQLAFFQGGFPGDESQEIEMGSGQKCLIRKSIHLGSYDYLVSQMDADFFKNRSPSSAEILIEPAPEFLLMFWKQDEFENIKLSRFQFLFLQLLKQGLSLEQAEQSLQDLGFQVEAHTTEVFELFQRLAQENILKLVL